MNTYILDTNVILHDPYAYRRFEDNHVVIPAIVLEEIDKKKTEKSKVGEAAREFNRQLLALRKETGQTLGERVELDNGGTLTIELNHKEFKDMSDFFDETRNDNRILAVAKNIRDENKEKGEKTILVTNDGLMIVKADALGILAEPYMFDRLVKDIDHIHTGTHKIFVSDETISNFFKYQGVPIEDIENRFERAHFLSDFVVMKSETSASSSAMGRIMKIKNKTMVVPFINGKPNFGHVTPRNSEQKMMAEALLDSNIELLVVLGEAGSGKTLLSLAASIFMMENKDYNYKKLMVARPVVPVGGKDTIGFLPGELEEKLKPWMMPIYDNLEYYFKADNQAELEKILAQKEFLEVQALTHIRGRSLPNQLILIDEAQNLTGHEVKTILSRAGEGTKVILVGDIKQIDTPYLDETNNGLTYIVERMKHEASVSVLKLEKTERSNLADLAVKHL